MRGRFTAWVGLVAIAIAPLPLLSKTTLAMPTPTQPAILLANLSDEDKGFQDGMAVAKKGGYLFPAFDTSEQYKRGYYDGFKQYSEGYKDGAEAARDGRAPVLITNPTKTYREAFEEGYISVTGKPGAACLKAAFRRNLPEAKILGSITPTDEGLEITTRRGVYICKLQRGRVVSLSPKKQD